MRVIPSYDKLEDRRACFDLRLEAAAVKQLALEGGKETLAHGASSLAYNSPTIYIGAIIGDLRIYQKFLNLGLFFGAGDRFRTDDLVLGNRRRSIHPMANRTAGW